MYIFVRLFKHTGHVEPIEVHIEVCSQEVHAKFIVHESVGLSVEGVAVHSGHKGRRLQGKVRQVGFQVRFQVRT